MKVSQIAAQLYTLRDFLKTPPDIAASLKKVRALGYEAVQISGMGPIPEEELVAICRGEGLAIVGTHESGDDIFNHTSKVIDRLGKLGCKHTAYPWPAGITFTDKASVAALIKNLDTAGAALRREGLALSYHNHAIEMLRVDGRPVLRQIYDETDPANLLAELDTYWIQYGGGDPAAWCARMKGRLPWLHCKDYAFTAQDKPAFAEVGNGNLEWQSIIAAATESGCEWFIVEQDVCPGDPFDSLKASFDYLKATFCR